MFKCVEMTFENWSGHSSIEIIGPLHYRGKLMMDLNYPCRGLFFINSHLIYLSFGRFWVLLAGLSG